MTRRFKWLIPILILFLLLPLVVGVSCTPDMLIYLLISSIMCGVEVYVDGDYQGTLEHVTAWARCVLQLMIPEGMHTLDFVIPGSVLARSASAHGMQLAASDIPDVKLTYNGPIVHGGRYEMNLYLPATDSGAVGFLQSGNEPYPESIVVEASDKPFEPPPPTVASVSPDSGNQGQTLDVNIMGTNLSGASTVSFGAGITINSFSVVFSTLITANITVAAGATLGPRDVSVTTLAGTGALAGGFTVGAEQVETWNCPIGGVALIAPYPGAGRPFLTVAVGPAEITVSAGAELWGIYYLDETVPGGEWLYFIPGFIANTLTELEPDDFYYVLVSDACTLTIPQ